MADVDVFHTERMVDVSINISQPTPTIVPLKDDAFIEAAGLQRSGKSGRKSSVERLLEESLNTTEKDDYLSTSPRNTSFVTNGTLSGSDDEGGARRSGRRSVEKRIVVPLKDDEFLEAAGLKRSGQSGRKSSVERLLEESLNTTVKEDYDYLSTSPRNTSFVANGTLSGSDDEGGARRSGRRSVEKRIIVPLKDDEFIEAAGLKRSGQSGRKSSVEKLLEESLNTTVKDNYDYLSTSPKNTSFVTNGTLSGSDDEGGARRGGRRSVEQPQNLKSDDFIESAGLSRTGRVARQSSMEKLLEDQLHTGEEEKESTRKVYENDRNGDQYLVREKSGSAQRESSIDKESERKNSIYEKKNIEAPVASKGNRITARTQNLFKQYERDMSAHEVKPIVNVNERTAEGKSSYSDSLNDEKRKIDLVREEKERELVEMRLQYQQRLDQEEREEAEQRKQRIENSEVKYVKSLGDVKNRYLSVASGKVKKNNDSDEKSESQKHVDKHGAPVEKSGGKIEIVKSSDGVGNIRERFGSIGKGGWIKRQAVDADEMCVDSNKVNSARSLFKTFEVNKSEAKTFNRPTSKKVRDPKELMEMRKKLTYGGHNDELPQDGVIKKTVILNEDELGMTSKKDALHVYKNFETTVEDKPTVRILSESETRANMEVKRSGSSSNSEAGDVNSDLTVDVSGYGSGTPCSPTSTASDGYSSLSDTKEPVDDTDGKDGVNINQSVVSGVGGSVAVQFTADVNIYGNDEEFSPSSVNTYDTPTYI